MLETVHHSPVGNTADLVFSKNRRTQTQKVFQAIAAPDKSTHEDVLHIYPTQVSHAHTHTYTRKSHTHDQSARQTGL